jgi:hypothetical protein
MTTAQIEKIRSCFQTLTTATTTLSTWQARYIDDMQAQHAQELADLAGLYHQRRAEAAVRHDRQVSAAAGQLAEAAATIHARWQADRTAFTWRASPWTELAGVQFAPPVDAAAPGDVRIGRLRLESDPGRWDLPAMAPFLGSSHLLIDARGDAACAAAGQALLQSVLLRVALTCPPRRVQFVLCEPGGAGSLLAGFLHLPASQRGAAILTRPDEIASQLAGLIEHITRVTQERLRNVYATLAEYNAANPATAVAYRVLVVAGLPAACDERLWASLLHIARGGPHAGVYLLATVESQATPARGVDPDELLTLTSPLDLLGPTLVWRDAELGEFTVIPDAPPPVEHMNAWLSAVGEALEQVTTSLPFSQIAPAAVHLWRASSHDGLEIPIGLDSAGGVHALRLGRGVVHHGLIGGAPGAGKSNLLHVLITQLALAYAPEEVELYLLDFREGVEFRDYLALPHARVVALESEREFGLSILERLDREIEGRGEMFKAVGAQFLPDYRATGRTLPRILLIVDEFQVLFAEDDALARRAGQLLDDLTRRGRGFGIHVLLSSQMPSVSGLYSRALYEQMGLRMAFKCSPQVSQMVLGDGATAAARLTEPGQAIYNDGLGEPGRSREVRVALLTAAERRVALAQIARLAGGRAYPPAVSFSAHAPARLDANSLLQATLSGSPLASPNLQLWLGEPIAIKQPTTVELERYDAGNLLVVGDDEGQAYGLLLACLLSAAAQRTPQQARFIVADFSRPGSPFFGLFGRLGLPHSVEVLGPRQLRAASAGAAGDPAPRPRFSLRDDAPPPPSSSAPPPPTGPLAALESLIATRQATLDQGDPLQDAPDVLFLIAGLHAWRELQPVEYGKPSPTAAQLLRLAEQGPEVGVHLLIWADGLATLEQVFKRSGLASFRNRALLRLSESDSNQLLGSPAAARLADQRAYLRVERRPLDEMEKFKPYSAPDEGVLTGLVEWIRVRMGR